MENQETEFKENKKSNKALIVIIIGLLVVVAGLGGYYYYETSKTAPEKEMKKKEEKKEVFEEELKSKAYEQMRELKQVNELDKDTNTGIKLIATENSKLVDNAIWAPTLQLVWQDYINTDIKQDIEFIDDKDNVTVKELNTKSFKLSDISDSYVYVKNGKATKALKEEIKKAIKDKFNTESEILDLFDFKDDSVFKFFYSMLYKEFTFKNPFDVLDSTHFGIDNNSDSKLAENCAPIFYTKGTYAIKLLTNEGDEVILYKGERKNTFLETYNYIMGKQEKDLKFNHGDSLKVANLDFKAQNHYEDLTKKLFYDTEGNLNYIAQIEQVTSLKLDNKGGKVKSEAGMMVYKNAIVLDSRDYLFNDDFMLFIKEAGKDKPYFAANINDVNQFTKKN